MLSARYEVLRHGGGGASTSMLCGLVRVDQPAAGEVIRWLPKVVPLDLDQSPQLEWLQSTLHLVAAEARELRAGSDAVITRLADLLVVDAIRSWIVSHPAALTGWIGALRDRHIGQAMAMIHRHPGRRWTVARLASAVGMSRSAFAARFTELVGTPVLRYVTDWRMRAAHASLRNGARRSRRWPIDWAIPPKRRSAAPSSEPAACRRARSAGSHGRMDMERGRPGMVTGRR